MEFPDHTKNIGITTISSEMLGKFVITIGQDIEILEIVKQGSIYQVRFRSPRIREFDPVFNSEHPKYTVDIARHRDGLITYEWREVKR